MKKLNPMLTVVLLITICLLFIYVIGVYSLLNDNNNILESNKEILQLSIASLGLLMTILGFYYGYKKYERDKELELIEKYGKKYDLLKKENNYKGIINLWIDEYFLYKKGYINNELWLKIEHKIEKNISYLIRKNKLNDLASLFGTDDIINQLENGFGNYFLLKLNAIKIDYDFLLNPKNNKNINKHQSNLINNELHIKTKLGIENDLKKINKLIIDIEKYIEINEIIKSATTKN